MSTRDQHAGNDGRAPSALEICSSLAPRSDAATKVRAVVAGDRTFSSIDTHHVAAALRAAGGRLAYQLDYGDKTEYLFATVDAITEPYIAVCDHHDRNETWGPIRLDDTDFRRRLDRDDIAMAAVATARAPVARPAAALDDDRQQRREGR